MLPTLLHLPHSPWSLKARCALRHQGLAVHEVAYRPFIDEPATRLRLARSGGRWWGRVSVPLLLAEDGVARDSWQIARYAVQHADGARLIPERDLDAIEGWSARSDRILEAGRARFMVKALGREDVLRELVPKAVAGLPGLAITGSMRVFNAKYGIRAEDFERHGAVLRAELDAVRSALADGRPYLTGEFSYADIAVGIALHALRPLPGSGFGPASEQLAQERELAGDYADLLAFRDRLHAEHDLLSVPDRA